MSSHNNKRSSILKKRQSTSEASPTITKNTKKIIFSEKKAVKEFLTCEEKRLTIWGNSYEEDEKLQSTQSSDGSRKSNMEVSNFSATSMRVSGAEATRYSEHDKENINYIPPPPTFSEKRESDDHSGNSVTESIVNMTLPITPADKKRMKDIQDNESVDMSLEDLGQPNKNPKYQLQIEDKLVLSPRKLIFNNAECNLSVYEKIRMKLSEVADMSISLQDTEQININTKLKTPYDLTLCQLERLSEGSSPPKAAKMSICPPVEEDKKRETVFAHTDMSVADFEIENPFIRPFEKDTQFENRKTVIQSQIMEESFVPGKPVFDDKEMSLSEMFSVEKSVEAGRKIDDSRKTEFKEIAMDESLKIPSNFERKTTFHAETMEETLKGSRKTQFEENDNLGAVGSSRKTQFEGRMEETLKNPGNSRKTDYQVNMMEESNVALVSRKTQFIEKDMEESVSAAKRKTQFEEAEKDTTNTAGASRKTQFEVGMMEETFKNPRKTNYQQNNMDYTFPDPSFSTRNELLKITAPSTSRKTVFNEEAMSETLIPSKTSRKTEFQEKMIEASFNNPAQEALAPSKQLRKTVFQEEIMEESLKIPKSTDLEDDVTFPPTSRNMEIAKILENTVKSLDIPEKENIMQESMHFSPGTSTNSNPSNRKSQHQQIEMEQSQITATSPEKSNKRKSEYHQQDMEESLKLDFPHSHKNADKSTAERSHKTGGGIREAVLRKSLREKIDHSSHENRVQVQSEESRKSEDIFVETPVNSPDHKKLKYSESVKKSVSDEDDLSLTEFLAKTSNPEFNFLDNLDSTGISDTTEQLNIKIGKLKANPLLSTFNSRDSDTSQPRNRSLFSSQSFQNKSISKMLTPTRDSTKKVFVKSCLDETEKFFSENLINDSISMSAKKMKNTGAFNFGAGPKNIRRTLYAETDMSVTEANLNSHKVQETKAGIGDRRTVYGSADEMSITITEAATENLRNKCQEPEFPKINRRTVYGSNDGINLTRAESEETENQKIESQTSGLPKISRKTVYGSNEGMNLTHAEIEDYLGAKPKILKPQADSEDATGVKSLQPLRKTIYGSNEGMNLTTADSEDTTNKSLIYGPLKMSRMTVYGSSEDGMNLTKAGSEDAFGTKSSVPGTSKLARRTVYGSNDGMNITQAENEDTSGYLGAKPKIPGPRRTVYGSNDGMNLTKVGNEDTFGAKSSVHGTSKMARRTVYGSNDGMNMTQAENEDIENTKNESHHPEFHKISRKTVYGSSEGMNLTQSSHISNKDESKSIPQTFEIPQESEAKSSISRKTVYDSSMITIETHLEVHQSINIENPDRKSIYRQHAMDLSQHANENLIVPRKTVFDKNDPMNFTTFESKLKSSSSRKTVCESNDPMNFTGTEKDLKMFMNVTHLEPETSKLQGENSKIARKTVYATDDPMNFTQKESETSKLQENALKTSTNPRMTVYGNDDPMNFSRAEIEFNARKTISGKDDPINFTLKEPEIYKPQEQDLKNSRKTVYGADNLMNFTHLEPETQKLQEENLKAVRKTVYGVESPMNFTHLEPEASGENLKPRKTVYGNDLMDQSVASENTGNVLQKIRKTINSPNEAMNFTLSNQTADFGNALSFCGGENRKSAFSPVTPTMNVTKTGDSSSKLAKKPRKSFVETIISVIRKDSPQQYENLRKSVHETARKSIIQMPENPVQCVSVIKETPKHETPENTCNFDIGKLGRKARNSLLIQKCHKQSDDEENSDDSDEMEVDSPLKNQTQSQSQHRLEIISKTLQASKEEVEKQIKYCQDQAEVFKRMKICQTREKLIVENPKFAQKSQENYAENMEVDRHEQSEASKSSRSQEPVAGVSRIPQGLFRKAQAQETEVSNVPKFRPSNMYDDNDVMFTNSFRGKDGNEEDKRKTFVVQEPEDKRKTFVISQQASVHSLVSREKSLNSTSSEADVIIVSDSDTSLVKADSFLDNESNPCVTSNDNSNIEVEDIQLEDNFANQSAYFKNFINLTVTNLLSPPCNSSTNVPPNLDTSIHSTPDYMQKFDQLCRDLENKNQASNSKVMKDFDDHLKKMQVVPVKSNLQFKTVEDLEANFARRRREVEQSVLDQERENDRRKREQPKQYPEIPSATFLMNNWLENLEEQIQQEMAGMSLNIAPIFPESKDFVSLLENKIKTEYSQWGFEPNYAPWGYLKFWHRSMLFFVLTIKIDKDCDIDSSTIPVYFKKIEIVPSFWTRRRKKSIMENLLIAEFQKKMGGDNFLNRCQSSRQLFEFLDHYELMVAQSHQLNKTLIGILLRNGAILEIDDDGFNVIYKRHFCVNYFDIVDIKFYIYNLIEDVDHQCVEIQSCTNFKYQIRPFTMTGLVLIETILWDVEKFLRDFTTKEEIPEEDD